MASTFFVGKGLSPLGFGDFASLNDVGDIEVFLVLPFNHSIAFGQAFLEDFVWSLFRRQFFTFLFGLLLSKLNVRELSDCGIFDPLLYLLVDSSSGSGFFKDLGGLCHGFLKLPVDTFSFEVINVTNCFIVYRSG